MKIKNTILVLSLGTLICTSGWGADPTDAAGLGIERIEKSSRYAFFVDDGNVPHYLGCGDKVNIKGDFSYSNGRRFWAVNDCGHDMWQPDSSITTGNLTIDIRQSQIDKELFDTHLAESNYGTAWRMAAANEKGNLWKRQTIA